MVMRKPWFAMSSLSVIESKLKPAGAEGAGPGPRRAMAPSSPAAAMVRGAARAACDRGVGVRARLGTAKEVDETLRCTPLSQHG